MNMGDFRGWLDTVTPGVSYDEVVEVYLKVADMKTEEERAYCVAEGIRREVIYLCFGYDWGKFIDKYGSHGLPGNVPDLAQLRTDVWNDMVILRPFVKPVAPSDGDFGFERVVDVLKGWPVLRSSVLDPSIDGIYTYLDHFKSLIDRRTMLMRKK